MWTGELLHNTTPSRLQGQHKLTESLSPGSNHIPLQQSEGQPHCSAPQTCTGCDKPKPADSEPPTALMRTMSHGAMAVTAPVHF